MCRRRSAKRCSPFSCRRNETPASIEKPGHVAYHQPRMSESKKAAVIHDAKIHPAIAEARRVLEVESAAILGLIDHLDNTFVDVVELINSSAGRVITMGLG